MKEALVRKNEYISWAEHLMHEFIKRLYSNEDAKPLIELAREEKLGYIGYQALELLEKNLAEECLTMLPLKRWEREHPWYSADSDIRVSGFHEVSVCVQGNCYKKMLYSTNNKYPIFTREEVPSRPKTFQEFALNEAQYLAQERSEICVQKPDNRSSSIVQVEEGLAVKMTDTGAKTSFTLKAHASEAVSTN